MNKISSEKISGIWSASPTPLHSDGKVDERSIVRMVQQHLRLGVNGLFLAGSCGEGALLPPEEKRRLVRGAVEAAGGRLLIAVQASAESTEQILENISWIREDGADIAMIGHPPSFENPTPDRLAVFYLEAVSKSPLPVGLYDLGDRRAFAIPSEFLGELYGHPKVVLVKDSSLDTARMAIALEARKANPKLRLFNGDEFHCVQYLSAGYDGLMLGGGIFNGYIAGRIIQEVAAGNLEVAESLQMRMTRLMYAVYGGVEITCWLGGLKHLLVEMGIFSTSRSLSHYPLTEECKRAIREILSTERELLLPDPEFSGHLGLT